MSSQVSAQKNSLILKPLFPFFTVWKMRCKTNRSCNDKYNISRRPANLKIGQSERQGSLETVTEKNQNEKNTCDLKELVITAKLDQTP